MLLLDQVVDVGYSDFRRETRVNGTAAGARAIQIGTRIVGINDVLRLETQALEISIEQRRVRVDVQHAWNADADFVAILHERDALPGRSSPCPCRNRVGDILGVRGTEDFLRGDIDKIRVLVPDLVQSGFDVFHFAQIFYRSFFAGGNNQPLLAVHERNLGDALEGHEVLYRFGSHVNEGAQTIVLAEIATGRFIARCAVLDLAHGLEPDERRLLPVAPQTQRFLRGADRPGLSAVLMHNDFRLLAGGTETIADEIHFGLHHGEIVLRPSLQNKPRT